jgi:uncharacterized membrane protein YkvA (DUF1232 family)
MADTAPKKRSGKLLLIIGVLAFIYMFIPEPTDVIPGFGWIDELFAGGVSFSTILAWLVKNYFNKRAEKKAEEEEVKKQTIIIEDKSK